MRRGVTLIEMLVVVAVVAVIAGFALPSATTGIEGIRLRSAADSVSTFLNAAMNRAERRQDVIEVIVAPTRLELLSTEPGYARVLTLPDGITVAAQTESRILLQPGGTVPAVRIDLTNRKGVHRIVQIDPITGVPRVI